MSHTVIVHNSASIIVLAARASVAFRPLLQLFQLRFRSPVAFTPVVQSKSVKFVCSTSLSVFQPRLLSTNTCQTNKIIQILLCAWSISSVAETRGKALSFSTKWIWWSSFRFPFSPTAFLLWWVEESNWQPVWYEFAWLTTTPLKNKTMIQSSVEPKF